jgi:hypothetical protein
MFLNESKIEMKTYSLNYLSEAFEIDRGVGVRCTRDTLPDLEKTKGRPTYKIATFAIALEAYHLKNASNNDDGTVSDTSALTAARTRIAIANAEAKEHANAIRRGEYTLNEVAVGAVGLMISTIREGVLCMGGKTADRISALRDTTNSQSQHRSAVFEIINEEAYSVLEFCKSPESYVAEGTAAAMAQPMPPVAPTNNPVTEDAALGET